MRDSNCRIESAETFTIFESEDGRIFVLFPTQRRKCECDGERGESGQEEDGSFPRSPSIPPPFYFPSVPLLFITERSRNCPISHPATQLLLKLLLRTLRFRSSNDFALKGERPKRKTQDSPLRKRFPGKGFKVGPILFVEGKTGRTSNVSTATNFHFSDEKLHFALPSPVFYFFVLYYISVSTFARESDFSKRRHSICIVSDRAGPKNSSNFFYFIRRLWCAIPLNHNL